MNHKIWTLVYGIISATCTLASDTPMVTLLDSGQMPRCLSFEGDVGRGVLFRWNERDHYTPQVQFAKIEEITTEAAKNLPVDSEIPLPTHPKNLTCWDWQWILRSHVELPWRNLNPLSLSVEGYPLSEVVLKSLDQVRLGGTVYREDSTAEEFLANHPIDTMTLELNRSLTQKYGVGFIASLYRNLESRVPENQKFRERARYYLFNQASSQIPSLKARFAHQTLLIGSGLGNHPETGRTQGLIQFLKKEDFNVEPFNYDPLGKLRDNSQKMEAQILGHIQNGRHLVIVVVSKSAPEALAALARLQAQGVPVSRFVDGVINISGVLMGSMYSDWFNDLKGDSLINLLGKLAALFGAKTKDLGVYRELAERWISQWYETHQVAKFLPKDIYYLNIVGVLGDDGKSSDPATAWLRQSIAQRRMSKYGANDGYLEYPGTLIPKSWAPRSATAIFDAGHVLSDGSFEGIPMKSESDRVFRAVFHAFTDLRQE